MKQMSLIEMDGFLKGKCIPRDLKVNETNAEYLVRKFGELESKLETALRECRSAGVTIDNLEAKCVALAADNEKAMEAMRQADAAVKLAQEKFSALAAENAELKFYLRNGPVIRKGGEFVAAHQFAPKTPATDAFLAEARESAIPSDVMAAIQKVARIRIDLNDFDGDKRGIVDCLGEAEESLIEVVNKFAAQLCKGGNQ